MIYRSPTEQHRAIVAAVLRAYVWPCAHDLELREERRGDLRCARCDRSVSPREVQP